MNELYNDYIETKLYNEFLTQRIITLTLENDKLREIDETNKAILDEFYDMYDMR